MTLETKSLSISYGSTPVIHNLNLMVPAGKITVLIGCNGCGKSTLLRTMARLMKPKDGSVLLDGKNIFQLPTKQLAKQMAILPQGPVAPEGLTVQQLIRQGRYPYQTWLNQWSEDDEQHVQQALRATNMEQLKDRAVDSLSGGQRQRAWIAMVLAQNTDTILLDEPTTYLDLTHQIEVLDLLYDLNIQEKRTIVMVLHDINLAARYAHQIVAVHNKSVYSYGDPASVINEQMMEQVFNLPCRIIEDPLYRTPLCIPHGKSR